MKLFSKKYYGVIKRLLTPITILIIVIFTLQGCDSSTPKPKGIYADGLGATVEFSNNKVTHTLPNGMSTTLSFKMSQYKSGNGNYTFDFSRSPYYIGWAYDADNNIVYVGNGTYRHRK